MGQLDGLVVVVTGGNGGIGLGMAEAMAHAGADIVIWGRNGAKNRAAAETIRATGRRAESYVCDVADEAQVVETFAASVEAMGKVDSLFANSGVSSGRRALPDISLADWRRVMAVNLDGVFLCFREAARHLIARGEGGSLVAVTSTATIHGPARNEAYAAAKTGLLGLVRSVAVELARNRIRVNALAPGWTITELARAGYEDERFREVTTQRTPVRRWAEPAEMGPAAVYLADPTITFHTGDHLVVDGGYTVF
jgi:NAD(P)-dependent dehydrogenase (short-subunit alcohol dehydrogenase family)